MSWGGTWRFTAALALALSLVLAGGMSVAADGSPGDLRSVLAPPPATDYVEASPKPDTLDGPFDAKGYADFVSAVNDDDASVLATTLAAYGFARGYGVTWIERGTRYYLEEFVFEFRLASGAKLWLADEKDGTMTMTEYRGELEGGTTIPGAWTGRVSTAGPYGAYRVGFVKGNDYYVISFDSHNTDLTSAAVQQAQAQYTFAPSSTTPPGLISTAIKGNRNLTAVAWVVGVMIAIILVGTVVILLILARQRKPAGSPVISMTPGAYSDVPMNATRSPDGAYWWDGVTWRPIVPPRF